MSNPVCPEDPSVFFLKAAASLRGLENYTIDEIFGPYDGRVVLWRTEIRGDKLTKVPYQARSRAKAKSNAPATWGDFETARASLGMGGFEGLGIMLGDLGDGRFLVGVDWDLCRSPLTGEIMPWARNWVDRWPSYIEISPSGTGLKGFGLYTGTPAGGGKEITLDEPIPAGAEGTSHTTPEIGYRREAAGQSPSTAAPSLRPTPSLGGRSAPKPISAIPTAPGRKVRWRTRTVGSAGFCRAIAT